MFLEKRSYIIIGVVFIALVAIIALHSSTNNNASDQAQADTFVYDLTRCEAFESAEDQKTCQDNLIQEMIFRTGDIAYCDEYETDERDRCRLRGVIHAVKQGASLEMCDQLDPEIVEDCKYNIVLQQIKFGGDKSLCASLNKPSNVRICEDRYKEGKQEVSDYNRLVLGINGFLTAAPKVESNGILPSEIKTPAQEANTVYEKDQIKVLAVPHLPRYSQSDKNFTLVEAVERGIDVNMYSPLDFKIPFDQGKGVASGDFDNDGWTDLVFATRQGIRLYKNTSQNSFVQIKFSDRIIDALDTFIVSFVDINEDGWLDIYVTSYGEGQYFILNDKEGFQDVELVPVEVDDRIITQAASFADIDQDGDLDFYQGYLSHSTQANRHWSNSTNHLVMNDNLNFSLSELDTESGETLTALFSDINLDGIADLLVGNDFETPDSVFIGEKDHSFRAINRQDNLIPQTPYYNMSYDTGDVNNDLLVDIFSVDLGDINSYTQHQVNSDYCLAVQSSEERKKCEAVLSVYDTIERKQTEGCLEVEDATTRDHCLLAILSKLAIDSRNSTLCDRIPNSYMSQKVHCQALSRQGTENYQSPFPDQLEQDTLNALLIGNQGGTFDLETLAYGVEDSHWSWTAKFADLDNDEWQDIYVGNGYEFDLHRYTSNIFFHNEGGTGFSKKQEEFGLTNYFHTTSYTLFDIDNDGDLDIVSNSINAPGVIALNNESTNNSLTLEVRDRKGNSFGIGTKVFIYYEGGQQMREMKSGGGFVSFDAPQLHFGLADKQEIQKMVIKWSTGEETVIDQKLSTNQKYIITRE